jgi:hypothetical protein
MKRVCGESLMEAPARARAPKEVRSMAVSMHKIQTNTRSFQFIQ